MNLPQKLNKAYQIYLKFMCAQNREMVEPCFCFVFPSVKFPFFMFYGLFNFFKFFLLEMGGGGLGGWGALTLSKWRTTGYHQS